MLALVLALACTPRSGDSAELPAPAHLAPASVPARIDFGPVPVGAVGTQALRLVNDGELPLPVQVSVAGSAAFGADVASVEVPAGGEATLELRFTPTGPDALRASLELGIGLAAAPVRVELAGVGQAPALQVAAVQDLGAVALGCAATAPVRLTNAGNAELRVSAAELLVGEASFHVADAAALGALAPGQQAELAVQVAPVELGPAEAVLRLHSDDPVRPEVDVRLQAQALDGALVESWVHRPAAVDLLLLVDPAPALVPAVEVLREGARAIVAHLARVDARIGVMALDDPALIGLVDAALPGAGLALDQLLELPVRAGRPQGLDTLVAAVGADGDVGPGSSFLRDEPALRVLALTSGADASDHSWLQAHAALAALEAEPSRVQVDVLAGDWPGGCGELAPAAGWFELSAATGGSYASACAPDFSAHFEALADELLAEALADGLPLAELPVEATLAVEVDGVALTEWSYRATDNRVLLHAAPPAGATVTVRYTPAARCE